MDIRRYFVTLPLALGFAAVLLTRVTPAQFKTESIRGVWQSVEVTMNGHAIKPQSNLTFISGRHYSRTELHADQPRPALPDPMKATADELRAVWGPFVGEAGTYELSGGHLITMRPMVAKNPAAMSNGAFSVYSYKVEGNTITLTEQRNQKGPIASPATIKAVRVE